MATTKKSRCTGLKIFIGVTCIFLLLVLVALIVLFQTILKPKEPSIITIPVSLDNLVLVVFPVIKIDVKLTILVTIDNPNYGSFTYQNSTANVRYYGNIVAQVPMPDDRIPPRGKHNITTSLNILGDKLTSDANFSGDFNKGVLNFTSEATLHGKVSLMKLIKKKATSYSTCNISIFIMSKKIDSICESRVSF
ncbi:hypothetical protein UlMin_011373 [Ulmus minor]